MDKIRSTPKTEDRPETKYVIRLATTPFEEDICSYGRLFTRHLLS